MAEQITSVVNAVRMMELLCSSNVPELTVQQLSSELGLTTPKVRNLLHTLASLGWVSGIPESPTSNRILRWSAGPALPRLGIQYQKALLLQMDQIKSTLAVVNGDVTE